MDRFKFPVLAFLPNVLFFGEFLPLFLSDIDAIISRVILFRVFCFLADTDPGLDLFGRCYINIILLSVLLWGVYLAPEYGLVGWPGLRLFILLTKAQLSISIRSWFSFLRMCDSLISASFNFYFMFLRGGLRIDEETLLFFEALRFDLVGLFFHELTKYFKGEQERKGYHFCSVKYTLFKWNYGAWLWRGWG